ncbi:MAG: hypothetical protein KC636_00640, partial [Myxococcales bacterium]|nr:hypothetical protein [Myxococcales bacterium]
DASDVPSAIGALAFPVDPPEEESPLSLLFQPRMKELVVEEVSRDRQFRRVQLSLSSFVVRGRSPAVRAINDEVRRAEQRDDWPEHAQGRDGDIDVYCAHGVATSELFSFGCEILDSTLMVEEVNEGTGGVPPNATGSGYTFAIVDDTLHPVALTDLLRPDADFAARIRELVAADEWEDTAETRPWREGECGLGLNAAWMLSDDGLKLWSDDCPPLVFDLDMLEPLLLPGGVVARYFQARRAAEVAAAAAAEREAAQAAAAAAAAASTDAPTSPLSPASPTGP